MANVKLGNNVLTGVNSVKLQNADQAGEYVEFGGSIKDVETASEMNTLLIAENVGKAYRFTGTTDANYTNGDIYIVEASA